MKERNLFKGAALLSLVEVINNILIFGRNIILARGLTKEDFGIAAALGILVALLEFANRLSFGQQIMRSSTSPDDHFVATAHCGQLISGVVSMLLVWAAAGFNGFVLGNQGYMYALGLTSLVPLLGGLTSLDTFRAARMANFKPLAAVELVPQIAITLAAWPMAHLVDDYRAIVYLSLGKAIASCAASHWMSPSQYQISFDRPLLKEMFKLGLPMLASSLLAFFNLQGDRALVGAFYSASALASYTLAATVALAPTTALFKVISATGLPFLAHVQSSSEIFIKRYKVIAQGSALVAALTCVLMIVGGEALTVATFGTKYEGTGHLVALLTIAQALRMIRGVPTLAAFVYKDSKNGLLANIARISALLVAVVIAAYNGKIEWIAYSAIAGEAVSLLISTMRTEAKQGVPSACIYGPFITVCCSILAAVLTVQFGGAWGVGHHLIASLIGAVLLGLGSVLLFVLLFSEMRAMLFRVKNSFRAQSFSP